MKRLLVFLILVWTTCAALGSQNGAFQDYYRGEYNKADPILLSLSESNNSKALYFLANMNLFGYGAPKNTQKGMEYMLRSAELHNLKAQMYLGAYYLHNKKDLKEALLWLKKAAGKGNSKAQLFTSLCYLNGFGVTKNIDTARRYFIKAAQNGVPMAQFELAKMFLKSRHSLDKKMGRIWILKAAKNNYSDAALTYGLMLYHGNNIKKNRADGIAWIEHAISLGNKNAEKALNSLQSPENALKDNSLEKTPALAQKDNTKPWPTMIALLKKAKVDIVNPKRILAKGDAQTEMPTLQSLQGNVIIKPDYSLVMAGNLPMHYILMQASRIKHKKQAHTLPIHTYPYVLPKDLKNYKEALQVLSRQAKFGDVPSLFQLGQLYENGYGVKKNRQIALVLFRKTAELKYLKSEYMVGLYYLKGWVVPKNIRAGVRWLRAAALHGSAPAQYLLGNIYEYGLSDINSQQSVKQNIVRAKAMYSLAAQNGVVAAQYRLAQMYTNGLFNSTNNYLVQENNLKTAYQLYLKAEKGGIKEAEKYLAYFYAARNQSKTKHRQAYEIATKFAQAGDTGSMLLLATLFERGIGVPKNRYEAINIYRSLTNNNNALSNFMLGTYYYHYDNHDKRATEYLTKAAAQGSMYAQYNLAIIAKNNNQTDNEFLTLLNIAAERGFGKARLLLADYYLTQQNDHSAMQHASHIYQQLAKKQNSSAMLKIGYMYQKGVYYSKNITDALYWYKQSADLGNALAQYQLGEIYLLGLGTNRNIDLALSYYMKSANLQFAPAMVAVGYIKQVNKLNYQAAKKWYEKAAKLNNEQAKKNLKLLKKYL